MVVMTGTQDFTQMPTAADLVIRNGRVWTVDPSEPQTEAVAVVGNRIVAVGTEEEIRSWVGSETRIIDAGGASVLPGFIDSHVHFTSGGFELSNVQLRDAATPEEFAQRIGAHARKLGKGEWILGGTWDHESWDGAPEPVRQWIDQPTAENPVFVRRYDGHMGLANSLALRLAGITRETPDPPGGSIVRDADGEPTGILKDGAMQLVGRVIPAPTEKQLLRAAEAALAEARRLGVTGVHDISSPEDARTYQTLYRRGKLTARIYSLTPIEQWEATVGAGLRANFGNEWLRLGALKGFADGSLGSTTALFFEPYDDAPDTAGLPAPMMFPEGNMLRMALGADRAGLQLCIHAIGDRANRLILEVFEEVTRRNPPWNAAGVRTPGDARRWRIEHAQHVHPDDFATFARLGVIASMQPYHAIDDGRWAEKRIGRKRIRTTYAFRTFLNHGVPLAFGSDWTVAPLDPLEGIYAAVTRRTLDGRNPDGWVPVEKITVAEAIEAYTMGSAYAEFAENVRGSLTPGKLADIVVLDRDLFALPPERIREARVRMTIVDGRIVYAADAPQ
jgi:predicted amidohydrolase YtcJ